MSPEVVLISGAVVAGVVGAYLSALETVLARINLVRALRLEDEERRGAPALLWLAEHRVTAMDVVLVVTIAARVAYVTAAVMAGYLLAGRIGVLAGSIVALLAAWIVVEIAPRTAVLRHLESAGLALAGSGRGLVKMLGPVARLVVGVGRSLVPRHAAISGPNASDDELRGIDDDAGERDDEIEPEERAMIRSIFELADTRVREIMTPRPDMVMVAADATLSDVVAVVTERGVSRVPVHEPEDPDRIVGVVYAKDLLARVAADGRRWQDLQREPTFVPETKRGDDLLRELQAAAVHLAIVVDEYGDVVGLVTIEDILEEIVGEIVDEHDQEEPLVEVLDEGLRVDGRLGVDDLNELLSSDLPEEGWDTVGGLVFGTLGRVPDEGESVEIDGVILTIENVQGRRVGKVLVVRSGQVDGADGAADDHDESIASSAAAMDAGGAKRE
ncbi:MAG: hemolysin family protein [Nitriliruptoraceae bacterium]